MRSGARAEYLVLVCCRTRGGGRHPRGAGGEDALAADPASRHAVLRDRRWGHVAADTRHVTRDCAGVCFMVGLAFGLMIVVEESLSKLWAVVER